MNKLFLTLSTVCSIFSCVVSVPWNKGPGRGHEETFLTCLDPFTDGTTYGFSHLDNSFTLSYCNGGCVLKNGAVDTTSSPHGVVCKEQYEQGYWYNKWQVKKLSTSQVQLYMNGVGYLKINDASTDDVVPLYLDPNSGTTWTVENIRNNVGYCVVALKSPNGRYIGHGSPATTSAWSVLRPEYNYPDLAVKTGGPGKPESSDAFKFVVQ